MLVKCQVWVETQPSCQSPLQKLNVDNTWQKRKELYITFLKFCPIFLYLFSLCQIFLLGLSEERSFLLELGPVSFTLEFVDIFRNFKAFLQSWCKYKAILFRYKYQI